VEAVLGQLREHGLLDDAAFAQYWVEQRQTFRPRGARLLRAELRGRGVDAARAEVAAESVAVSAEDDAYRAALRRARQLSSADERLFKVRIGQFLARRGFEWDTVTCAVDRLWLEVSTS
jgi:regulatory protein